jgi:acyl transferase domain-containing protein/acyl carrier protein
VSADSSNDKDHRARLTRALTALRDMRSQLEDSKRMRAEPIAIVGLGCRFPGGAADPDRFWQLLQDGRDAIREVPRDRWDAAAYFADDPQARGKICTCYGGFLDRIDQFDPHFFAIAPREAASMDPQQRLLLEVAWESLEHAGIASDRLGGSRTGVFVGISSNEYAQLLLGGSPESIDPYMGSGNAHSVAAGRLSYVFGFEGPSVAIDTACSSSLVAVHLACQSLRLDECDLALAGGVNVMLTPAVSINHSQARMLAPDGRCKTFDASADGFVRAEGCGLVVLKRLSRAVADGDLILAEIRGSAVNQDGHTSGLTVPSGASQQRVMRDVLARAGLKPSDVSYVEAHGTGTALGDPIEVQALAAVFGEGRPARRPLFVGSVKTNIGHAEAAAGVAGLIKAVLALEKEIIPAHLHFHTPNPRVAWNEIPIAVATSAMPWPRRDVSRIAGVSSFGFGGTNAHVILSDSAQRREQPSAPERPLHVLALSAQSNEALRSLAGRYEAYLQDHPDVRLGDLCHTANVGRSHLRHRLCLTATTVAEIRHELGSLSVGQAVHNGTQGKLETTRGPRVAFLFTGQGAQYLGMARELFCSEPAFRHDLELCNELFKAELERPLLDVLYARDAGGDLDQTGYTQPALFALEYCLGRLWMSWGVVPDLLLGHSVGEYVAACLAGMITLADAIRLVACRARLMQVLPSDGAMAAIFATEVDVCSAIRTLAPAVSIAAINAPWHQVISGPRPDVERLVNFLAGRGVETHPLNVSQAFHSALMEPILPEFKRTLSTVSFVPPKLDVVSNVTGRIGGQDLLQAEYWCRHVREPVRFADGMRTLAQEGVEVFLEVGPHPVLLGMGRHCVTRSDAAWLPSLRRGQNDWRTMLDAISKLYVRGVPFDWRAFDAARGYRRVHAPTYPFERQRHWMRLDASPDRDQGKAPSRDGALHALLGVRRMLARRPDEIMFEGELAAGRCRLLDDHQVFGLPTMPASGYVEMAIAAGAVAFPPERIIVESLRFQRPLALPPDCPRVVQTVLQSMPSGGHVFEVHSRAAEGEGTRPGWTLHASGVLRADADASELPRQDLHALRERNQELVAADTLYDAYSRLGVVFGASLRAVEQVHRSRGEALGLVRLPNEAASDGPFWLHPVWLDACAQIFGAAMPETDSIYLQASVERVRIHRRPDRLAWVHARARPSRDDTVRIADLSLIDEAGTVLAELAGVQARRADPAPLRRDHAAGPEFYELRWLKQSRDATVAEPLPVTAEIARNIRPQLQMATTQPPLLEYADALTALDELAVDYVVHALRTLGWRCGKGEGFSSTELEQRLGIVPQHRRLLQRLLSILVERGMLRANGSRFEAVGDLPRPAVNMDRTIAASTESMLLHRCGQRLAEVLTGACDPLQLLFADGEGNATASIYQNSPGAVVMHGLLRAAVRAVCQAWPAGKALRFLEIGAGTGGATAHVLPELPPTAEYTYTDISRGFFENARAQFAGYPFVRYETLDIEQAPGKQRFGGRQFDVVIAFNVLHATRSLRESVAHVRELLAPGGLLLLLENTEPAEWVDVIWGLTPGWWRFEDHDLRPSYPLLSAARWRAFLMANGFPDAELLAVDPERNAILARQAFLIARRSEIEARAQAKSPWLVLTDATGVGDQLVGLLQARRHRVIRASRGTSFARISADRVVLDPASADDFRKLAADLVTDAGGSPCGIVFLWGLDTTQSDDVSAATMMSDSMLACGSALHLVQAFAAGKGSPRVWLVTRGAQPAGEAGTPLRLGQAALWGLGKTIAREHPQSWGGMIDLDPNEVSADEIVEEITRSNGEDHIAFRNGQRFVARIATSRPLSAPAPPLRADASYLITGGCGALGLQTARLLVQDGCRHLALVGRSGGATAGAREAIAALEQDGVTVSVFRADVADEDAVVGVLSEIAANMPPLRGVVHAAGLPGRCAIGELDLGTLREMFAAKVSGTWNLHRLTRDLELDFFVCFSSMVSLWGAKEQGHYTAANHFLDAFAHFRSSQGRPATCINWGPISGGGMLPQNDVAELRRIGVSTMPLDQVIRPLQLLLRSNVTQAAPLLIDWRLIRDAYQSRGPCRLFDLVAGSAAAGPVSPAPQPAIAIVQRLREAPEAERRDILLDHVRSTVVQVLSLDQRHPPEPQMGFFDMGMDSLTATEVRSKLQSSLGVNLPPTLVFDYGSLDALTDFLLRDKLGLAAGPVAPDLEREDDLRITAPKTIASMSDQEVERLLEKKLQAL